MQFWGKMNAGTTLNERYRVVRTLEEGAQRGGILCEDLRIEGKRWVIEQAEGELGARTHLHHPGLPVVSDQFQEGSSNYLVTDFIQGEDLATRLERGPLERECALRLAIDLGALIKFLHRQDPPIPVGELQPEHIVLRGDDHGLEFFKVDWESQNSTVQDMDGYWDFLRLLFPGSYEDRSGDIAEILKRLEVEASQPAPPPPPPPKEPREEPTTTTLSTLPRRRKKSTLSGVVMLIASLLFVAALTGLPGTRLSKPPATVGRDQKLQVQEMIARGQFDAAEALLARLWVSAPEDAELQIMRENVKLYQAGGADWTLPVISSLSGDKSDGARLLYGLALAQAEQNQNGPTVALPIYDDESSVEKALAVAQELAANKEFPLVIGPWTSQHLLAIGPIFNSAGKPIIAPAATDPRVFEVGHYVYSAAQTHRRKMERLAEHFHALGLKRNAVVMNADNVASRSSAVDFEQYFKARGGEVVAQLEYSESRPDLGATVAALEDLKVDCIYLAEWRGPVIVEFSRRLRRSGAKQLLAIQGLSFEMRAQTLGSEDMEGCLITSYLDPEGERSRGFCSTFRATFPKVEANEWDASAYDVFRLVVEALEEAGDDPERLQARLRSIGKKRPLYSGVSGDFAPGYLMDTRRAYLFEARGGHFRLVTSDPQSKDS